MSWFGAIKVLFLISHETMTVQKKLFLSSPMRKNIIINSNGLDLWTEKAGNSQRNHAYVENILNCIIIKQGLKGNNIDY